jgi:uncharacterized membrane protein YkvA (DUF1232 family)
MNDNLPAQRPEGKLPAPSDDPNIAISWLKELVRQARLAWHLFWDPRVPLPPKLIPPAVLIYVLSPIDIIPDLTLGLGQLDDMAVVLLGIKLFIELCPTELVREHLKRLGAKIEEWQAAESAQETVVGEEVIEGEFEPQESVEEDE